MIRRTILAGVLILAVAAPALVYAEHTRFWRQSDFSDFEKGTAKGVAIRSDGRLMPALKFAAYSDPNLAYLWALRVDSRGRIYGAGGSDAKVLRFDDPAKPTTVFESPELAAQAIAFDSHDNLYVGTSPDGKIYKVSPEGQKSVFFDPKSKYIWALAIDAQGVLFAGTGDDGKIFAVAPDGKGELFYQSDERHARSLAFDSKGNLLAGTDPDGLILRIEISRKEPQRPPKAGPAFVLYETDKKEVTSLLADSAGKIYAAAIGEKQRPPSPAPLTAIVTPQQASPLNAQPGTTTLSIQAQPTQAAAPFSFFPSTTGGSDVVEISPEGAPTTVWTSREELVFAMGLSADGKILLGTGNKGAIIELEGNNVYSSIAKTASAQVDQPDRGPRWRRAGRHRKSRKNIYARSGLRIARQLRIRSLRRQDFFSLGTPDVVGRQRRDARQGRLLRALRQHFQPREKLEPVVRPVLEPSRRSGRLPAGAFHPVEGGVPRNGQGRTPEYFLGKRRLPTGKRRAGGGRYRDSGSRSPRARIFRGSRRPGHCCGRATQNAAASRAESLPGKYHNHGRCRKTAQGRSSTARIRRERLRKRSVERA